MSLPRPANGPGKLAKLKALTDAKIIFALTTPVDEQRQAESKGSELLTWAEFKVSRVLG